jgi:hypothetical protein
VRIRWTAIPDGVMAGALFPACSAAAGDRSNISGSDADRGGAKTCTVAMIGEIPYGHAQIAKFPGRIDQINADRRVELVDHLEDINNGSSLCTDEYLGMIKSQSDWFADPLIYIPADNESTDCHPPAVADYFTLQPIVRATRGNPRPSTARWFCSTGIVKSSTRTTHLTAGWKWLLGVCPWNPAVLPIDRMPSLTGTNHNEPWGPPAVAESRRKGRFA